MSSVFDDLVVTSRDLLYPMGDNRDENMMVEFNGIIHSESETIFYGMKDCPILEAHPFKTYQRLLKYDPDTIYSEIAYFRPFDLVQYLNDGEEIDEGEINAIIEYATLNYNYSTATLLAIAEAINNLFQSSYLKNVTFVLPDMNENNLAYLIDIYTPEVISSKCKFVFPDEGKTIIETMKDELLNSANQNYPYTTIITNEYQLILDILRNYKEYKADTTLFLLRNHSQNMKQSIKGDSVVFEELYTTEILGAINGDEESTKLKKFDFPVKAKFGRFKPFPYSTGSPSFMTYA